MKKEVKKEFSNFKRSFRLDKRFFKCIGFDVLYIILFLVLFIGTSAIIQNAGEQSNVMAFGQSLNEAVADMDANQLNFLSSNLRNLLVTIMSVFVLNILLFFGLFAWTRLLIWNMLRKGKFTWKKLFKIFVFGPELLFHFLLGTFVLLMFVRYNAVFAILLYLFIVLFMNIYFETMVSFVKTGKLFESIGKGFEIFNKQKMARFFYCLMFFLLFAIASLAVNLFGMAFISNISGFVLLLFFFTWMRLYISDNN